ncbi:DMT family transporter [Lacibacterium aquatile]|uniref:DMT family transporter n=1 Tax=Lacibacterium aquatile TaxID=1168082 RepID=A0ABW5DUC8_9PROT
MTAATATASPPYRELTLLLLLATLWGASYTLIKFGIETIPPITLIAARTLIAGLLLLAVLRMRGIALPMDRGTWGKFFIQACLNSALPFTLIAWAELSVDAGLAGILNSLTPVMTVLLTLAWSRHEALSGTKLLGVALGLGGVCLIVGVQALQGIGDQLWGQLAVVLATACYAGAAIFGKNFKGLDPIAPAAGSLICGAIILIPLSLIIDRPWTLTPSNQSLTALLILAVFSTAGAFTLYFRLIHTLGSVGTTAQGYLRTPIAVGIGALFLGESLTSTAWIGLVCVILGVMAITWPRKS